MPRILLTGKTGQVGWELERALAPLGDLIATGREQLDLTDPDSIRAAIRQARPDIIVNAAGYTTVDKAEAEPELAMQINGVAPGIMAEEAKRTGALLVHYSTDYVYDGTLDRPYTEEDVPNPVNVYGKTKLAGENAIQAAGSAHLILRTSWVYAQRGQNFVLTILRLARERQELSVVTDQTGSPTWARALAAGTADVLRRGQAAREHSGIYHLAAAGGTTRYEFARAIIGTMKELTGLQNGWAKLKEVSTAEYPRLPAARPTNPLTSKEKMKRVFGLELERWESELRECLVHVANEREMQRKN
jgi:dTDP-4-dehydrorhamnose reductase